MQDKLNSIVGQTVGIAVPLLGSTVLYAVGKLEPRQNGFYYMCGIAQPALRFHFNDVREVQNTEGKPNIYLKGT